MVYIEPTDEVVVSCLAYDGYYRITLDDYLKFKDKFQRLESRIRKLDPEVQKQKIKEYFLPPNKHLEIVAFMSKKEVESLPKVTYDYPSYRPIIAGSVLSVFLLILFYFIRSTIAPYWPAPIYFLNDSVDLSEVLPFTIGAIYSLADLRRCRNLQLCAINGKKIRRKEIKEYKIKKPLPYVNDKQIREGEMINCPTCDGNGYYTTECGSCGGSGYVTVVRSYEDVDGTRRERSTETCGSCGGSGKASVKCKSCNGFGKFNKYEGIKRYNYGAKQWNDWLDSIIKLVPDLFTWLDELEPKVKVWNSKLDAY